MLIIKKSNPVKRSLKQVDFKDLSCRLLETLNIFFYALGSAFNFNLSKIFFQVMLQCEV